MPRATTARDGLRALANLLCCAADLPTDAVDAASLAAGGTCARSSPPTRGWSRCPRSVGSSLVPAADVSSPLHSHRGSAFAHSGGPRCFTDI